MNVDESSGRQNRSLTFYQPKTQEHYQITLEAYGSFHFTLAACSMLPLMHLKRVLIENFLCHVIIKLQEGLKKWLRV